MTEYFAAERIKELERQVDMQALEINELRNFRECVVDLLEQQIRYYEKEWKRIARKSGKGFFADILLAKADGLQDFRAKLAIKLIIESEK
jgi:hypothetical protein